MTYALVLLCTLATPCEYAIYHKSPMTQAQCQKALELARKNTPLEPFCVPYAKGRLIK